MACSLVERPAQGNRGKEDGLRVSVPQGKLIPIAQQWDSTLEVRPAGEVQAEGGERTCLGQGGTDRPRDRQGGLGERH